VALGEAQTAAVMEEFRSALQDLCDAPAEQPAPSAFSQLLEGWPGESCFLPPPPATDWPDGHRLPLPSETSAAQADAGVSLLPRSGLEIHPGHASGPGLARALAALASGATAEYMARGWAGRHWRTGPRGRCGMVVRYCGFAVDVMYAESLSELIDTVCATYGWD
jgi:hypothetical protein